MFRWRVFGFIVQLTPVARVRYDVPLTKAICLNIIIIEVCIEYFTFKFYRRNRHGFTNRVNPLHVYHYCACNIVLGQSGPLQSDRAPDQSDYRAGTLPDTKAHTYKFRGYWLRPIDCFAHYYLFAEFSCTNIVSACQANLIITRARVKPFASSQKQPLEYLFRETLCLHVFICKRVQAKTNNLNKPDLIQYT